MAAPMSSPNRSAPRSSGAPQSTPGFQGAKPKVDTVVGGGGSSKKQSEPQPTTQPTAPVSDPRGPQSIPGKTLPQLGSNKLGGTPSPGGGSSRFQSNPRGPQSVPVSPSSPPPRPQTPTSTPTRTPAPVSDPIGPQSIPGLPKPRIPEHVTRQEIANRSIPPVQRKVEEEQQVVQSEVRAFETPKNKLDSLAYRIGRKKSEFETRESRGEKLALKEEIKQAALGVGAATVNTVIGVRNIFTNPLDTATSLPSSIKQSAEQFGIDVRENPSFALGSVLGNIAIGKGTSAITGKVTSSLLKTTTRAAEPGELLRQEVTTPTGEKFIVTQKKNVFGFSDVQPIVNQATGKTVFAARSAVERITPAEILVREPPKAFRKLFSPEQIEIDPVSRDAAVTLEPAVFNEVGVLINRPRFIAGSPDLSIAQVNQLRAAVSERVPGRSLSSLAPEQREAFLQSFEKATGRPISQKVAEQVFRDKELSVTDTQADKLGKVVALEDGLGLFKPVVGKSVERSGSVTASKLIFDDSETFSLFRTETGSTSLNLPETAVNAERIKGIVKVRKPIFINEPTKEIIGLVGAEKTTTKTVQQIKIEPILKAIGAQEQQLTKSLPKASPPIDIPIEQAKKTNPILSLTAGTFAGQGLYERTQETAVFANLPSTKTSILEVQEPQSVTAQKTFLKSTPRLSTKQISLLRNAVNTIQASRSKTKEIQTPITSTAQQTKQKQTPLLTPKLGINKSRTPRTPLLRFPVQLPKPKDEFISALKNIQSSNPEVYNIFVRRFGKDRKIGTTKTKFGAGDILEKEVISTLGASGFVTDNFGRKVGLSELGLSNVFTKGKKDPLRAVQRRGTRLSVRSEVSEIMASKRKKSKKARFFT